MALIDEKPATGEQKFVRHRNSDDAQHQQRKNGHVAVRRHPLEDGVLQLERIAK